MKMVFQNRNIEKNQEKKIIIIQNNNSSLILSRNQSDRFKKYNMNKLISMNSEKCSSCGH